MTTTLYGIGVEDIERFEVRTFNPKVTLTEQQLERLLASDDFQNHGFAESQNSQEQGAKYTFLKEVLFENMVEVEEEIRAVFPGACATRTCMTYQRNTGRSQFPCS